MWWIHIGGLSICSAPPFLNHFISLSGKPTPPILLTDRDKQVLVSFSSAFHAVNPGSVPGFAFAWLELISHRTFMPNLLLAKQNKGWHLMHRLLVDLFVFMEPHLRR